MADESVNASGTKKKKKSIFKRIAKGMSIKKKKKHPDDASVMGVSVAENSVTGPPMSNGNKVAPLNNPPIQIILLLMDPNSRRFELLQLEFDSSKALVSDVLLQVNLSATETTLRDMVYGGVCDQTGMEMIASCKLSMFCNPARNEIILAMPKGMSGSETAVLAKPILEDEKVVEMLRPCGVQLTARPKKSSAKSGASKLPKIDEDVKPRAESNTNARVLPAEKSKRKTKASYFPTQVLGIVIAAAFFFLSQQHNRITRHLQSGLCLLPGEWISKCGVWELIPGGNKFCDMSSVSKLSMGKDGKLRYFDKDMGEMWNVGTCAASDDEQCVMNIDCQGAAFTLEGKKWFVEVNGDRKPITKEVVEQFI